MMKAVYKTEGAQLSIDILSTPQVREFIESHSSVLDSSFEKVEMSDAMRKRLHRSDFIFSGIKTFHELNEAFPSLIDENGERKPFERFLNDVRSIDQTYNSNYLRAEYNFVSASAEMAAKWDGFMQDGDRYNLQYRTQKDDKVRPEHAALDGVTLSPSDPFWAEFYPPNGWNCRCTVVQVRKSKYPVTPHDEAMRLGDEALQRDSKGIFRFNPGLEQKTVPDYNPYTIHRCRDCDIAKGKISFAKFIPDNHLCEACRFLRTCRSYETVKRVWEYVKELKNEVTVLNNVTASRLQTGTYYQTKKTFGRAIGHARDLEQAEMYEAIRMHLDDMVFLRHSPLGEGKDLSNPKDRKNVDVKRHRGVSGYNKYSLIQGDDSWIITMEVYKNRSETIYHVLKKE
ncbi:MAG: phage head morphogenesis protein [Muribaculaceae bacterium]|nr:phage head morphogenesis protein [Muribaculaceae bacterium]